MKKKKSIIFIIIAVLIIIGICVSLFFILNDKNKLTVTERNWVNDNISTIQNINIVNNINVFGLDGEGVFYDFLKDFETEYDLTINPITYTNKEVPAGLSFGVKKEVKDSDTVFYKDHYVLVSKKKDNISKEENLNGKTIGILSDDLSYVSKYLKKATDVSFKQFESLDELKKAMEENLNYMLVPLMEYLDIILENNYNIVYHFSDINKYYVMQNGDDVLTNIMVKYFNTWKEKKEDVFDKQLFKCFTTNMNITDTEVDSMQSISYNYGFVNASPYEVIMGGKYGGIVGVYLSKFSNFADVEFNFVKYKSQNKFMKAVNNKDVDLYFNYYNSQDNFNQTNGINIEYAVALNRKNHTVVKSIYSLIGKEVYVQKNSKIYDYVSNIGNINIKTYETTKDLFKLNNKDVYIILDKNTFDYYSEKQLDNYTLRYKDYINDTYNFKVRTDSALYKLLNKYISVMDENEMIVEGVDNHFDTVKNGGLVTKLAEYILYVIVIVGVLLFVLFKKSKKVKIAKKIKKDDKLKFIDQLTSLKNRNFLNENIETWNNNTIYPQTIIVIDLNRVQEINDLYGYTEGDKQIKALANILIKTQLDNSEVIRSDGNEFVVYLVGYTPKQVSNYIHKLNREIKKLPYNYGAEFGNSMILDDIKTIEDALNEAVEDMKKSKESKTNEEPKK